MTNALVTTAPVTALWVTKTGKEIRTYTATGALRAPLAVKTGNALDADVSAWSNGQFGPLMRDIRAMLSQKQTLALIESCNLAPKTKVDALAFMGAVVALFEAPKGHKARMVNTMLTIMAIEQAKREVAAQSTLDAANMTVRLVDCTEGSDVFNAWKASGSELTMVAWMDAQAATVA